MNPRRSQRININGAALSEEAPIVLLVDDEVAVRDVLAWVIQGAGYTPMTAGGPEGFEMLTEHAERVALVILDLTMHGLDGFRFRDLQRAQPRLADIPTLVMSGRPVLQEEKTRLRANDYIWKPARISELRSLIAEHARPIPDAHPRRVAQLA
jgi:two-component system, chemotaxis family, sensor histidine kinase and response regulator PixL